MLRFRIGIAATALAVCLPGPAFGLATPAGVGKAPPKPTKLQRIVRGLVAAHAPGALAFVRTPKSTRSATAGFAALQPRVRMQTRDHYRIASITKTFVATIVLQLAAEGRLSLDDPVARWLPGTVPNGDAITLRELLNHTSGLFNYTDDEAWTNALILDPGRAWKPSELLAVSFSHPPLFPPSTNWAYSNTNFVVLGLVIEAVTGKTLEEELRTRLFDPLALHSTSLPAGRSIDEPFAHGYIVLNRTLVDISPALGTSWLWAAGGIVSTAADVTTFFAALLKGRLLPAALLTQMETGSAASGAYGLGLALTYTPCGRAYGHEGDFVGWRNVTWSTASGNRVAVVMVNIDTTYISWSRLEAAARSALCSG
jgi:D-alanyl-D-alanine carboxypeptidase